MDLIQLFLLINGLFIGIAATLAVQHLRAHRSDSKPAPRTSQAVAPVPPAVRERIAKQAEENFQGIVNRSALQLQRDLSTTSTQLNKLLEKFGSEVLDEEIKLFRSDVSSIRAATQGSLSGAQDEITKQQTAILASLATRQKELDDAMQARRSELETKLEASFDEERTALTKRMETKLNDAVLAFLLETLGHEVDLGAQADYLLTTLEANKSELVTEIAK